MLSRIRRMRDRGDPLSPRPADRATQPHWVCHFLNEPTMLVVVSLKKRGGHPMHKDHCHTPTVPN